MNHIKMEGVFWVNFRSVFYLTPCPRVPPRLKARQGLGLGAMWGRGAVVRKYIFFFWGLDGARFVLTGDSLIRLQVQLQK